MFNNVNAILLGLLLLGGVSAKGQSNVFPTSGNVGIGTSNPLDLFHVRGDVRFERLIGGNNYISISGTSAGNYITTDDPGTNMKHMYIRASPTGEDATDRNIYFQTGKKAGAFQTRLTITGGGNVGIGTSTPKAKLAVEGNILAKEIKVTSNIAVPDYVFEPDYKLISLSDIEAYVKEHKHLPEIPSAKDIERDGLDLGEMNLLLLKKVEELTLHLIEKEKRMERIEKELMELKKGK